MNGAPPVLRTATAADLQTLARLHASGFDYPWSATEFASLLGAGGAAALVAERDGRALGFVLWRCAGGEAELIAIAVDEAARRQGIGARLLRGAADAAAESAETMFLEVATDNPAAATLYEKAGFRECGRRRGYYRRPDGRREDARLMRIRLK